MWPSSLQNYSVMETTGFLSKMWGNKTIATNPFFSIVSHERKFIYHAADS